MKQFVRRLLLAIPMLLVISLLVFLFIDLAPGDAAVSLAGSDPTPERIAEIRERLDLDDPVLVRYWRWLGDAVTGDFGTSLRTSEPVLDTIRERAVVTGSLVLVAVVTMVVVATILGVIAAVRSGKLLDRLITALSAVAIAAPPFWIGMVLIMWFALDLDWLPPLGYRNFGDGVWPWLERLILPAAALATLPGAAMSMELKTTLTEELGRDHILSARARGIGNLAILFKHAMKNALIPVVTLFGYRLAQMFGGAVTIEALFDLDGIGELAIASTFAGDVPVLLGLVVMLTMLVILLNLIVDTSYGYFNPRSRQ